MLNKTTKSKALECGSKSLYFIQQLKSIIQEEEGFNQAQAAYGLMLIDAYLKGQFLTEVEEFKG
jgi:hypothetical protein